MVGRSAKAQATLEVILNAAQRCFAESGFRGTTTRMIAAEAGVTQPLIHHYFGAKEALFDAVIERALLDYDQVQQPRWALESGDIRFFTDGLRVLFSWLGENREVARLVVWARLEGRLPEYPLSDQIMAKVVERFSNAQALGVVRAEVDLEMALILIDTMLKGYWERRDEVSRHLTPGEDLDQRYFREVMRVLLLAMFTPEAAERAAAMLT